MKRDDAIEKKPEQSTISGMLRDFFPRLVSGILRDLLVMAIVFAVATGISALVCLYYGVPLILSLIGGFLAVGAALFFYSASVFD